MSTEVPADLSADLGKAPRRRPWTNDLRTARVVRFAISVTAAVAIAFAYEWPLSFLTPVFTAVFLALPTPAPTLGQALKNCWFVLEGFVLGLVFTLFLLPFPLIYIPALGLILFRIFYLLNRGGSFWRVLMSLIAVLILPMLGQSHDVFPVGFSLYFILSGVLAVLFAILAHGLFPDPPGGPRLPSGPGAMPGYSKVAALAALKSTLVVLPIAVLFITMEWTGEILVMVFAAIFSLSPEISKGRVAARNSLTSTFIGGFAALVFYWLIVAVPEFHFFIALMLLTALLFGQVIFAGGPLAKYLPSAFVAVVILVGGSMGEGADIAEKFIMRVLLISAAAVYIVAALSVLDRFFFMARETSEP
ncbi:MAG: DUF2955 domain-containing protein [Pseudomonadota bacterium]|nr:DUF2955 domain-containing protein [Pseudomonadota bacterium]